MFKIIGGDQKEYGPVTADQINAWILEGRVNGQTLVQAEGSSEWKPLASFSEFAAVLAVKHSPPPLGGSAEPGELARTVLARDAQINVGECLSRGWRLLVNNLGLFLGASLLLLLIQLALIRFVPIIGLFGYYVVYGALYGGFYTIFVKRARGEPAFVGDLFSGFSQNFVQLMLAGIVTYLLTMIGFMLCILPGVYLAVAWKFSLILVADRRLDFWQAMELSRKVITRYWFQIFGVLVIAYLPLVLFMVYSTVHIFTALFDLIANSGGQVEFGQILRMLGGFATLSLVQHLIALFTLPFATAALMHAYEDLFGTRPAPAT